MNTKKLLLLLTLASPLMADPSSATPSPDQPIQDPWKQFKASHSLILFLNNTSTKANRCSKVRLDDLQESPRTLTEEDYDPNWVGGSGKCRLLPKETELV